MSAEDGQTNPFDQVPDWYQESPSAPVPPTPNAGANQPASVGPQPTQRPEQAGTSMLLMAFLAVLTIGGIALLSILFLGSDDSDAPPELAFADRSAVDGGDCFRGVHLNASLVLRATWAECDGDEWGRIPAGYEAEQTLSFPSFDNEFLRSAFVTCTSRLSAERTPYPIIVAENESEWNAGERRILCGAVYPEHVDDMVTEVNAVQAELSALSEELGIPSS